MLSKIAGLLKSEMSRAAAALVVGAQSKFLALLEAYKAKLPAEARGRAEAEAPEAESPRPRPTQPAAETEPDGRSGRAGRARGVGRPNESTEEE